MVTGTRLDRSLEPDPAHGNDHLVCQGPERAQPILGPTGPTRQAALLAASTKAWAEAVAGALDADRTKERRDAAADHGHRQHDVQEHDPACGVVNRGVDPP